MARATAAAMAPLLVMAALSPACNSGAGNYIDLDFQSFDIQPGTEREVVQFTRAPEPQTDTLYVNRIEISMRQGSHHFILFALDHEPSTLPDEPLELFKSDGTTLDVGVEALLHAQGVGEGLGRSGGARVIAASQDPYFNVEFPPGVALTLEPGQSLILDSHYINFDSARVRQAGVSVRLYTVASDSVRNLVKPVWMMNGKISIPPGETQEINPSTWKPKQSVAVPWLTSHMHGRGTKFTVHQGDSLVYENFDWDHPAEVRYDPPLIVSPSDGLRFTCTFRNDKPVTLTLGPTSEDEMCLLIGYYYPVE